MKEIELVLEAARRSDLDQLVALDARAFSRIDRYFRREWSDLLDESLAIGPARINVARSGRRLVGVVVVATDAEARDVTIVSLAVDQRWRRQGVASRLLRTALAQVPEEICTAVLEVRPDNGGARALYDSLGFRVTRRLRHYYADGTAALEYRAPLSVVLAQLAERTPGGAR